MLKIHIPGRDKIEIENMVFDYNGTIAKDGKLIEGVQRHFKKLSENIKIHVITADTHGSVEKELACSKIILKIIPSGDQDKRKLEYVRELGPDKTVCAGNGANDLLMLKECLLGVAVLGDEGLNTGAMINSDIVVKSIDDFFHLFEEPERLVATLRL